MAEVGWDQALLPLESPEVWRLSAPPYCLLFSQGRIPRETHPITLLIHCCRVLVIVVGSSSNSGLPNDYNLALLREVAYCMTSLIYAELRHLLMLTNLARSALELRPFTVEEELVVQTGYFWPKEHVLAATDTIGEGASGPLAIREAVRWL